MLDDLKNIHYRDKSDALGIAEKQYLQLNHDFDIPKLDFQIEHIVYAGMGGSALAARLSLSWPGYHVPFEIALGYNIPQYVSNKTLFIAASYSGNTEETVSALRMAEQAQAHIIVIASGGKLEEIALEKGYTFVPLPKGYQPRHAVLFGFKALVTVLERCGLVKESEAEREIKATAEFIQSSALDFIPTVATQKNLAKQIAQDMIGLSPVIYAGPTLWPAAYKWKINFNENAKNIAWCNQYSEMNHNEIEGWTSHPVDKPYRVVNLRATVDHPHIEKRFDLAERLLSGKWPHPIDVDVKGESVLEKLLWAVLLGDFVSLYTAILNGIDPTPVPLMEKLKKELAHGA